MIIVESICRDFFTEKYLEEDGNGENFRDLGVSKDILNEEINGNYSWYQVFFIIR
jgi:hypothetical protein